MFEYVFGFLVGAVTTYICLEGQRRYFDQALTELKERMKVLEGRN
mgnify:FL=1